MSAVLLSWLPLTILPSHPLSCRPSEILAAHLWAFWQQIEMKISTRFPGFVQRLANKKDGRLLTEKVNILNTLEQFLTGKKFK